MQETELYRSIQTIPRDKSIPAESDRVDYTHADLREADFAGMDLRHHDFRGADLRGADLRFTLSDKTTSFEGADFKPLHIFDTREGIHKTISTRLDGANMKGVNFSKAYLIDLEAEGIDFTGCNFAHANLSGAVLHFCNFNEADLRDCNLADTDLRGSHAGIKDGRYDFLSTHSRELARSLPVGLKLGPLSSHNLDTMTLDSRAKVIDDLWSSGKAL